MNRQSDAPVNLADARRFARQLRTALRLGRREFNVCFVSDREIGSLNATYRNKRRATDVLSFRWQETRRGPPDEGNEFDDFLGDVVISVPAARRNARAEGHAPFLEIRWLMLHGLLHLLGFDHETDSGEMTALELALRDRLQGKAKAKRRRHP